jgi:uncharacterized protein YutE (UPF0331/DUF86 family)
VVDKTLILRKIAGMSEYLDQLMEFSDITVENYSSEWKTQRIIERTLQRMIEVCADIAGHIISDSGYRIPKTYSDAFKILGEHGILDEALSHKMEQMAKFRNIVVHQYDEIDATIVVDILQKHLPDFNNYKDAIVKRLEE